MKYLIVGLGNIGAEYALTRHNIGFLAVDALAESFKVSFQVQHLGMTTEFRHKGRTFVLLKPTTYMNLSGKSVRYWLQQLKLTPENLMVISDDIHLPFEKIRIKPSGSDGGHNGLKSITELLGNNAYPRQRIGVGNNFYKGRQSDYVLGKWSDEEMKIIPFVLQKATDAILTFGTIGLTAAMNQYNAG